MAEPSIPKKLPQKDILGQIAEICIVTPDLYSTIDGLTELGIGPFQVFNFNSMTVKEPRSTTVSRGTIFLASKLLLLSSKVV